MRSVVLLLVVTRVAAVGTGADASDLPALSDEFDSLRRWRTGRLTRTAPGEDRQQFLSLASRRRRQVGRPLDVRAAGPAGIATGRFRRTERFRRRPRRPA